MDDVLKKIEHERFKSLYDPGIHGILKRLDRLGFLKPDGASCSGHPSLVRLDYKSRGSLEHQEDTFDSGYIFLDYKTDNKTAKDFHNKLRDISAEYKDYYLYFTTTLPKQNSEVYSFSEKIGKKAYKVEKYEDTIKTQKSFGFDNFSSRFDIQINSITEKVDPIDTAIALFLFWQKVSDLIGQYEQNPIRELLSPHYFGIRSNYGNILAAHPYFEKYLPDKQRAFARSKPVQTAKKEYRIYKVGAALLGSLAAAIFGINVFNWYFS